MNPYQSPTAESFADGASQSVSENPAHRTIAFFLLSLVVVSSPVSALMAAIAFQPEWLGTVAMLAVWLNGMWAVRRMGQIVEQARK